MAEEGQKSNFGVVRRFVGKGDFFVMFGDCVQIEGFGGFCLLGA